MLQFSIPALRKYKVEHLEDSLVSLDQEWISKIIFAANQAGLSGKKVESMSVSFDDSNLKLVLHYE